MNRKIIFRALGLLLGTAILLLVIWGIVAGPVTVFRILRYGDTDIDDFSHYPGRAIEPGAAPYSFDVAASEIIPPADALPGAGGGNLDSILEANDTIAFFMVRGDAVVYERYFQGHAASSRSQIFSVSKSITSALVGMAIDDGYIQNVRQPITDFIPELASRGFDQVSIHHLLTMTSGSSYQENDNPFGEHVILNFTPRLEEEILSFEMETAPGTVYRYKSGDNALLGLALSRALAPETLSEYARRRLWGPLGMEDPGVWTIDHEGDGLEKTWCCLALSARDLAKIGRLYLEGGVVGGEQRLSAGWIEESARRQQVPEAAWPEDYRAVGWRGYGYQWWLAAEEYGDFFGLGKDGQFLYVNPAFDVTIVRLGWSSGELRSSQWIALFQALAQAAGG